MFAPSALTASAIKHIWGSFQVPELLQEPELLHVTEQPGQVVLAVILPAAVRPAAPGTAHGEQMAQT